ncbi:heavy metal translocatin [Penicillium cinerascens]|uniref:Heavy metal translocatin n=1 Tax=Penicillium cinerascens TaxID=70096 RepID=A0A9W9MNL8_9EURO|nr:heavy metal translocatin [Penicillium cinerascens]KAJ5204616.1 heavy metal translocatin [Penicillium cinerascens]
MIAFIINSCEALDINLNLQYNESVQHGDDRDKIPHQKKQDATATPGMTIISVSGMTCGACTVVIENALREIEGVEKVTVSLSLQEARVFQNNEIKHAKLIDAVEQAGYDASVGERSSEKKIATLRHTEELQVLRSSLRGLVFVSTVVFCLGYGVDLTFKSFSFHHPALPFMRSVFLFGVTTFGVWSHGDWIFQKACNGAAKGQLNMHTLISASTIVGLSMAIWDLSRGIQARYLDSIIGVLLIITVGRYMDLLSRRRATDTFIGLYYLMDETSSARLAWFDKPVPTSALRPGDEIIIEPFSVVPCDGYVVEGISNVNEAILTGECLPKFKTVGDLLIAGSRNGSGELKLCVQQNGKESFLSQLIGSIESSLASKASTQQRVEFATQNFVAVVFTIAITAAAYEIYVSRDNLSAGLNAAGERLMAVLAAACPCALGLSTPCAVMAGIDVAWKKGILMLAGAETMETVQSITHVLLDKTGTLTQGTPQVTEMAINSHWKNVEADLAVLICATEEQSLAVHPLASAIFKKLLPLCREKWGHYQASGDVKHWKETGGLGLRCEVNSGLGIWKDICVGSLQFMKDNSITGLGSASQCIDEQGSLVFVSVDGDLAASIILQDTVRHDAKETVLALQERGLHVSLLTGDHDAEASRVSAELGIPVAASCATPDMKLDYLKKLQDEGHKFMMVGDGINDGPSLAAAEVGVMMAHGRRCFTTGGSVLIFQSQLSSLLTFLDISQSTMAQVSRNIRWALIYNMVTIALAVGLGSPFNLNITPPVAAAMMSASSIFITAQSLLLRARLSQDKRHDPGANELGTLRKVARLIRVIRSRAHHVFPRFTISAHPSFEMIHFPGSGDSTTTGTGRIFTNGGPAPSSTPLGGAFIHILAISS